MKGAWADLARFVRRHRWWIIGALAVTFIVFGLVALAGTIEGSSDDWSRMITVAEYGDGQKIQVRESILWAIGFLVFCLISAFGSRNVGGCNYPKTRR